MNPRLLLLVLFYSFIMVTLISSIILSMCNHLFQMFLMSWGLRAYFSFSFSLLSPGHWFSLLLDCLFVFSRWLHRMTFLLLVPPEHQCHFSAWGHPPLSWCTAGLCTHTWGRLGVPFLEGALGRGQASLPGPQMIDRGFSCPQFTNRTGL